ncbi:hypothetical protein PV08_00451 [Exophiala spinifera]|uniref:NmrA-like domain-containing protein n=1 Tax=Exophiala spinifera TaxID=91928 RepID=A0A0D1YX60_9EURO|nr:uncharacterized protein PV08_00451 [Exophiala spinifera]KIW19876.1 hypothetical protein PV08_00451 [Exophiala spinifera]
MSTPIKKVVVVGGSGLTGGEITRALLRSGFEVSVLSRASSNAQVPDGARGIKTDYSHDSLVAAFRGQDAVVSAITTLFVGQQLTIIDAAIEAGVRRFIPSEYGVDTSDPAVAEIAPPAGTKTEIVAYLKSKQDTGMSWSAIIVGAFFDAIFDVPGVLGLNLAEKTMTIFDGGDVEFEATNLDQIGRAVAAVLSAEHLDATANQYVYLNSFTLTQNQMLKTLQDLTGNKIQVQYAKKEDFRKSSQEKIKSDPDKGDVWVRGSYEGIVLIMLNEGGFCEYSKKGLLWNKKLGLPEGNVDETIKAVLSKKGLLAGGTDTQVMESNVLSWKVLRAWMQLSISDQAIEGDETGSQY